MLRRGVKSVYRRVGLLAGGQSERSFVARSHLKAVRRVAERLAKVQAELDEAMLAAQRSGESLRDIGEECGLSHQQVANRLKRMNEKPE